MPEDELVEVGLDGASAIAASFPGFATLAVAMDKVRMRRVLAGIDARIDDLAHAVKANADAARLAQLAEDPAFYIAFEKAAEAARLSESEDRLVWLRNGLINGYVCDDLGEYVEDREAFMAMVRRYTPRHIQVLDQHSDVRTQLGRPTRPPMRAFERFPGFERDEAARQALVADGLLEQEVVLTKPRAMTAGNRTDDQDVFTRHKITRIGWAFLRFIADPSSEADTESVPGA